MSPSDFVRSYKKKSVPINVVYNEKQSLANKASIKVCESVWSCINLFIPVSQFVSILPTFYMELFIMCSFSALFLAKRVDGNKLLEKY